jgi:hypothetical protein
MGRARFVLPNPVGIPEAFRLLLPDCFYFAQSDNFK